MSNYFECEIPVGNWLIGKCVVETSPEAVNTDLVSVNRLLPNPVPQLHGIEMEKLLGRLVARRYALFCVIPRLWPAGHPEPPVLPDELPVCRKVEGPPPSEPEIRYGVKLWWVESRWNRSLPGFFWAQGVVGRAGWSACVLG